MSAIFKPHTPLASRLQASNLPDWQLQDAKNRFSQVVRAAKDGVPHWVTVHGQASGCGAVC